ncbi:hypothetical protein [Tessaracoccus coleopterorum]
MGELAAPYDVSMQAVSKHLKVLEGQGSSPADAMRSVARCTLRPTCSTS